MSEAVGIHAVPGKALGKRPPSRRATLDVSRFLTGALPSYPTVDQDAEKFTWGMDHNDEAGDCVAAGMKHALETIARLLGDSSFVDWSDAKLLKFYQTQNPGFKDWSYAGSKYDGGMDVQQALETLVEWGDIVAFGAVDHTDLDALFAATYVGLAIPTGEELTQPNMSESVWDAHPTLSSIGGHCTVWVAYESNLRQVTWGELLAMTGDFVAKRVDEAWFILTKSMIANPQFRDSFDLAGFAAAVSALTKGKVVVPVTPVPTPPAPTPAPSPTGESFPGATAAVSARISAAAVRARMSVTDYQNHHWSTYFGIKP